MSKKLFIPLIFLLLAVGSYSQPGSGGTFEPPSNNAIVPPAPQAFQFQKYGDIPLDIKSGLPQIQVPLHALQLRDLSWNIGLRYNARGFKPSELATGTGLGWTMEGMGIISMQVFGMMDFERPYDLDPMVVRRFLNLEGSFNGTDCEYEDQQDISRADLAITNSGFHRNYLPDLYNLSLPGMSLKFFIHNDTGYTVPASDVKINLQRFYINDDFDRAVIKIQDEKGNKYYFSTKGYNKSLTLCNVGSSRLSGSKSFVFYIDSLRTLKGDLLKFYYQPETYAYEGTPSINYNEKIDNSPTECNTHNPGQFAQTCNTEYEVQESRLDSIVSSTGEKLRFKWSSRLDLAGTTKLDTLVIVHGENQKKILLSNSYFGSAQDNNLRLRLDSIASIDVELNTMEQKYKFQYSTTVLPPITSLSFDYFGFHNGALNTQSSPRLFNRNPVLSKAKACILERMIYPTGGITEFDYELNEEFGGLRIRSISDRTTASKWPLIRTYQYIGTGFTPGYQRQMADPYLYTPQGTSGQQFSMCPYMRYSSHPHKNNPYAVEANSFDKVIEYVGDNAGLGKTEYYFEACEDYNYNVFRNEPNLVKKIVFRKGADNSYQQIRKEEFKYEPGIDRSNEIMFDVFSNPTGNKEKRLWGALFTQTRPQLYQQLVNISQCIPKLYGQLHFALCSYPEYLTSKVTTEYAYRGQQVDSLVQSEFYKYASNFHLKATSVYSVNSVKDTVIQTLLYSMDYASGNVAIDVLRANNVLDIPVETTRSLRKYAGAEQILGGTASEFNEIAIPTKSYYFKGAAPVAYSNFKYSNVSTGQKPYEVPHQVFAMDTRYTLEAEVTLVENGNITELKSRNGGYLSYCYDEANRMRASIVNARITDVAYASFEIFEKNKLTYNGLPQQDVTAPTGQYVYSLNNVPVTKTGLNASGNYTVTFWLKNSSGTCTANGSSGTAGLVANGWTCYRVNINSPASGTITVSGSGIIDELRIYPAGAMITTYTYRPLYGVSGSSDVNNRSTYYEYDGLGRLKFVRDQNRHILKSFEYSMIGGGIGLPDWTNTNEFRCKPCLKNLNFNYGQEMEQIDINPESPSYNTIRWVNGGSLESCQPNDWQLVTTPVCEVENGQLTGYLITTKVNINPCSPQYNQQQVTREINLTACPYQCDSGNCSGVDKKCINGVCETAPLKLTSAFFNGRLWECRWSYVWSDGSSVFSHFTLQSQPCLQNP